MESLSGMDKRVSIDKIRAALLAREPRRLNGELKRKLRPSAVLAPVYEQDGEVRLLLTQRTNDVRHHKGQISFPGGRRDADDSSYAETAKREFEEEMGISRGEVEILGALDEQPVISYYRIVPFVARLGYPFEADPSPDEIERVITLPLVGFLDPSVHRMTTNEFEGRLYPIHFYEVGGEMVWGATGRIVSQLLEVCFGYRAPLYEEFLRLHREDEESRGFLPL